MRRGGLPPSQGFTLNFPKRAQTRRFPKSAQHGVFRKVHKHGVFDLFFQKIDFGAKFLVKMEFFIVFWECSENQFGCLETQGRQKF